MSDAVKLYTRDEAATLLRCDVDTLSGYLVSGELAGAKHGREWVILEEDLVAFHKKRCQRQQAPSPSPARKRRRGRTQRPLPELPGQV